MTIDQQLRLSYYRQVADINAEHSIYLVQDVRSGKFYVKKLLTVYNAEIYRYLQAHPVANTPKICLAEDDGKVLTVIEEFIPGDTLEELLERKGTLPPEQVLEITSQLCAIVSAFHSCTPAIVNRDIKPSNIKITPDGVVKLLDLNAAKWSNDRSAKDTVLLGTQGYAAPEQYGFGPSSSLTDIYSIGVVMNVMLTGQLPNQRIPEDRLGNVIRKCVELSPADRYQNIAELQAALDDLSGKPAPRGKRSRREYLPPGFRGGGVLQWLLSALGYAMIFFMGLGQEVEEAGPQEEAVYRVVFILAALLIVLFNGNYLDIRQKFILTKSRQWWLRWLGMAIVDALILMLWAVVCSAVSMAFFR